MCFIRILNAQGDYQKAATGQDKKRSEYDEKQASDSIRDVADRFDRQEYADRGYDIDRNNAATTLASMTVWSLYNSVTAFATHNDIWTENDCRRLAVCEVAVKFLYRDHDIKKYTDIYA